MDLDSIKRKIRSLQNLAGDSGAAEQEADNALRFARHDRFAVRRGPLHAGEAVSMPTREQMAAALLLEARP